jgi:peroxiredoxin
VVNLVSGHKKKVRLLLLLVVFGLLGVSATPYVILPVRIAAGIACLLSVALLASFPRFFSLRYWVRGSARDSLTFKLGDLYGGPEPGASAPEFNLKTIEGRFVSLQDLRARNPVVLVTGSYSCPAFRRSSRAIGELHSRYADRITFLILYTVEAHPKAGQSFYPPGGKHQRKVNRREGILVAQPQKYEERVKLAAQCRDALSLDIVIAIDDMDNQVWVAYGAAPNAAYLIDRDGKVLARQGRFDPPTFGHSIERFVSGLTPRTDMTQV